MTGLDNWAVLAVVFCVGYLIGSYQRNSTKITFYKMGVVEATNAINEAMMMQQTMQQQSNEDTNDKQPMGFHKPTVNKDNTNDN